MYHLYHRPILFVDLDNKQIFSDNQTKNRSGGFLFGILVV